MTISSQLAESLNSLAPERRDQLMAAVADVILSLDPNGFIEACYFADPALAEDWEKSWKGRQWRDTVTIESRAKVDSLLRAEPDSHGRQVNYNVADNADMAVLFHTVPKNDGAGCFAFGRDMQAQTMMQHQIVQLQIAMEREYGRLRAWETRYRVLAETLPEPVLVIDAPTLTVTDHNRAARALMASKTKRRLEGRPLTDFVAADDQPALLELLTAAKSQGKQHEAEVTLAGTKFLVTVSPFRQDGANPLIIHLSKREKSVNHLNGYNGHNGHCDKSLAWSAAPATFERMPDGIVTTDPSGVILAANEAFLDLTGLASADQLIGTSLGQWLGRPRIDLDVLIGQLKQYGRVRAYRTSLTGHYGTAGEIEVTAAAETNDQHGRATFLIRDLGNRKPEPLAVDDALPHSAQQLTQLVGQVPLKELVRQTTDVIERLCIESALQLTDENRASAAELLGLSRQGLYVKLRRYGLIDEHLN